MAVPPPLRAPTRGRLTGSEAPGRRPGARHGLGWRVRAEPLAPSCPGGAGPRTRGRGGAGVGGRALRPRAPGWLWLPEPPVPLLLRPPRPGFWAPENRTLCFAEPLPPDRAAVAEPGRPCTCRASGWDGAGREGPRSRLTAPEPRGGSSRSGPGRHLSPLPVLPGDPFPRPRPAPAPVLGTGLLSGPGLLGPSIGRVLNWPVAGGLEPSPDVAKAVGLSPGLGTFTRINQ